MLGRQVWEMIVDVVVIPWRIKGRRTTWLLVVAIRHSNVDLASFTRTVEFPQVNFQGSASKAIVATSLVALEPND